jgi:hypothetical protein
MDYVAKAAFYKDIALFTYTRDLISPKIMHVSVVFIIWSSTGGADGENFRKIKLSSNKPAYPVCAQ